MHWSGQWTHGLSSKTILFQDMGQARRHTPVSIGLPGQLKLPRPGKSSDLVVNGGQKFGARHGGGSSLHDHQSTSDIGEVRGLERYVGVPVSPANFERAGAHLVGGRIFALLPTQRAAMIQYVVGSGNGERRGDRFSCIGGIAGLWAWKSLKALKVRLACKLLVHSGPMLAGAVYKKLLFRFRSPRSPLILNAKTKPSQLHQNIGIGNPI